ncbi:cytochrome c biogenesis protein/redoxin [Enterobacteriaceae bacterium H18W14]|uniref:cytochrome c biogenesis protein/redoxin n=1 Tax=Dryocola boscaweniae TaxID=2925397 RepID=UPI0022F0A980|nr:cytochrome c biogenesis protein/redoxin [Dryocola boscaweniae]MCT4717237.1 cytochrome c biogenesis protein/redoxin [Dryocola boscaweniae]
MFLLIAFLGGSISLLSPCTLPVIPLLFAGFGRQKRHIAALLLGMVVMFSAVAMLVTATSEWVVQATIAGRWLALALLAVAALALIFPRLAVWVMRPAVRLGNVINDQGYRTQGALSAFLAGLAVGLLWSPCAGPVLGVILAPALAGKTSVSTGLLLAAYGSGCAVTLAGLWLCGKWALLRLRTKNALMSRLHRFAGIAMLTSVVFTATGMNSLLQGANGLADKLEQRLLTLTPAARSEVKLQPAVQSVASSALPSLAGGTAWINGAPAKPESLKGKVVLIDFWTFDCINCQHTLPHVREWANKYKEQGLVVIGVHTPEYPWEKNLQSVKNAVNKWQLPYPVVTDNNYQIWNAFGNHYWPAHYYFDVNGTLRYAAFGEGDYAKQEQIIQSLLKEVRT